MILISSIKEQKGNTKVLIIAPMKDVWNNKSYISPKNYVCARKNF